MRTAFITLAFLLAGCGLTHTQPPGLSGSSPRTAQAAPAKRAAEGTPWPDRRPIGLIQLADHSQVSPSNPDGYWPHIAKDFNGFVTQSLDRAVALGCQGVLFYDVEGQRYPVPVTYVGHPFTGTSAKIGKTTIRAWCKQAAAKGLTVGFCHRQTAYVPGAQLRTISPAATLGSEFVAARDYYGPNVKLIYWDSNIEDRWWEEGGASEPLNVVWLRRLRDIIGPDVLVMTEFAGKDYATVPNVAPIRFFDGTKLNPTKGSPIEIVVPPSAPVTAEQRASYVEAMKGGAICWTTATWSAPDTEWVPGAYAEATQGR